MPSLLICSHFSHTCFICLCTAAAKGHAVALTHIITPFQMREYSDTPHASDENMEDVKFQMEVVDA